MVDFSRTSLKYGEKDIVKTGGTHSESPTGSGGAGPTFRYIYDKLLGPSFPGHFEPSTRNSGAVRGSYILSYPGVAFSFDLKNSAWRPEVDFVTLLSSPSVPSASSMVVFAGPSWQEVCGEIFTRPCPYPRALPASGREREPLADEVEMAYVLPAGIVRLLRRSTDSFDIVLGVTTPQDLVAELGPPDSIYTKSDKRMAIHRMTNKNMSQGYPQTTKPNGRHEEGTDTGYSSSRVTSDDSGDDAEDTNTDGEGNLRKLEVFYNYHQHGIDVLVSTAPVQPAQALVRAARPDLEREYPHQAVATKVLLHGNVPGSYSFTKYRRIRWTLDESVFKAKDRVPNGESNFRDIASVIHKRWPSSSGDSSRGHLLREGWPINRDWDSPGSSCELLGGFEEHTQSGKKVDQERRHPELGKAEMFGYSGLVFEVLGNGAISCLTVY